MEYNYCRTFDDFFKDNCNLSSNENKELISIIKKLNNLHKLNFSKVFSIGWDIMIDCKNKNNIKAYCLEGNYKPCVWKYNTVDEKIVKMYKQKAIKFYKLEKIY